MTQDEETQGSGRDSSPIGKGYSTSGRQFEQKEEQAGQRRDPSRNQPSMI